MKKVLSSVALGSLLLLVGAGCSQPTTPTDTNTPPADQAQVQVPSTDQPAPTEQPKTTGITLSGEAIGNNMVKFTWEIPAGAENPASFRLVRGQNEDPALPRSYYFQVLGDKRAITWVGLAPGKQYFRICTFVDNACKEYSNNVEVEVK